MTPTWAPAVILALLWTPTITTTVEVVRRQLAEGDLLVEAALTSNHPTCNLFRHPMSLCKMRFRRLEPPPAWLRPHRSSLSPRLPTWTRRRPAILSLHQLRNRATTKLLGETEASSSLCTRPIWPLLFRTAVPPGAVVSPPEVDIHVKLSSAWPRHPKL
jgi:hypothetical protein